MIRRFNYTSRIKIPRNRISISLLNDKRGKYFHAKLDLDGLAFSPDAKIYIEPNYKGVYQRFNFGSVSEFMEPTSTLLNELPETELAFFDVSIVDETGEIGLLLGSAKGIPVSSDGMPSDRIPLLPVNPLDLGEQFWNLSFDSGNDGSPILEINNRLPDPFGMARDDIKFICLVYPTAFRGVLTRLIQQGDADIEEDSWISQWLQFIDVVLHIKEIPDFDTEGEGLTADQESWIDNCINEYCKKLNLFEKFTTL